MLDEQAVARAERQAFDVRRVILVLRDVLRAARRRLRIADGFQAHVAGGRDVLIEIRGRDAQYLGHVVEAVARGIGRQQLRRVHADAEQVLHGRGVLDAIQPCSSVRPGVAPRVAAAASRFDSSAATNCLAWSMFGCGLPGGGIRLPRSRRTTSSQRFGFEATSAVRHVLERHAAGELRVVVAVRAVLLQHRPAVRERLLGRLAARRHEQRQQRNEPDCESITHQSSTPRCRGADSTTCSRRHCVMNCAESAL